MNDAQLARRLGARLAEIGYRVGTVAELLGPVADAALVRDQTVPAMARTEEGGALATLVRLWLLQRPVSRADAKDAFGDLLEPLAELGVLQGGADSVAARIDVRPYRAGDRDLWVASDLTTGLDGRVGKVAADYVLGLSAATTSLAQLTVRRPVRRALDLGAGSGVQSLHLAAHAGQVVATDVNPRALRLARLNAALNEQVIGGADIEVREGSFFEPVVGEQFELVVSNPPFVISPGTEERLVYRDSGLPGDRVVEHLVRGVPRHLVEGGIAQILANWLILEDQPWQERLGGWFSGCDAWVVQREVLDPAQYVELWLKDAGRYGDPDYLRRYQDWLSWFERLGVRGIGFGWINLRRTAAEPVVRLEEWPYAVEQPIGPEVAAYFSRADWLRGLEDDALRASIVVRRLDVVQETSGVPGAEDPATIVLRQQTGMCRARQVDSATAAFVGAADGDLSVGQLLDAIAELTGATADLGEVRALVSDGFLTPDTLLVADPAAAGN